MDSSQVKKLAAAAASCSVIAGALLVMKRFRRNKQTLYDYHKRIKRIYICRTHNDWSKCKDILTEECKGSRYLSIDCEWVTRNSSIQKVALLQLATESGTCVLLRLSHLKLPLPKVLIDLMNDDSILKVGVGCNEDARKLKQDYNLDVNGCVDLRHLIINYPISNSNFPGLGLRNLAKYVLGYNMEKNWRIQCGNWERNILSDEQINYAVQDAVVAVDIFHKMMKNKVLQNGLYRWLSYSFTDGELDLSKYREEIYELCRPFIDQQFKDHKYVKASKCLNQINKPIKFHTGTRAFSVSSKRCYENIQLLAPDGQILCMCNKSKAQWYLDNNRAVLIRENPMIVKLNFEPKGRPILDGNFYIQERKNICVVCGSGQSLLKRHIVPHEYRRFFPEILKSHSSHDILLLCIGCTMHSNIQDHIFRKQLAVKCNAPIGTEEEVKVTENPELKKVKSAARAILKSKENLPEYRLKELTEILHNHYNISGPISTDILKQSAHLDVRILNAEYVSHGEKVVSHYSMNEGLFEFQIIWRQHFLESMNPAYLTELWSTVHGHERILLKLESLEDLFEKKRLLNTLGVKSCL